MPFLQSGRFTGKMNWTGSIHSQTNSSCMQIDHFEHWMNSRDPAWTSRVHPVFFKSELRTEIEVCADTMSSHGILKCNRKSRRVDEKDYVLRYEHSMLLSPQSNQFCLKLRKNFIPKLENIFFFQGIQWYHHNRNVFHYLISSILSYQRLKCVS